MSSFAAERASHLSFQLNALLASSQNRELSSDAFVADAATPDDDDVADDDASRKDAQEESEQAKAIKAALAKLDLSNAKRPVTTAKLLASLQPLQLPSATASATADAAIKPVSTVTPGEETLQWALVSQTSLGTFSLVLSSLVQRASAVSDELDYWREVEATNWNAGKYLVQTLPERAGRAGGLWWERWRKLAQRKGVTTAQRKDDKWRFATVRQALLPPSLLLSSAFPHLSRSTASSSRSAFFLTLSPLLLTRQEAALKRRDLEKLKDREAERVGDVAEAVWDLERAVRKMQTPSRSRSGGEGEAGDAGEKEALAKLVSHMETALTSSSTSLVTQLSGSSSALDVASALREILTSTLPSHSTSLTLSLAPLSRPPFLVRAWPILVAAPLTIFTLSRLAWTHRETIKRWVSDLKETVRGFVVGWVVSPLEDILETIRAGDKGTLAIMSDESLKSDMASLERMVGDFGKERYGWGPEEVQMAEMRVKQGDLTEVLKAWEQEIKTPFRSAVGGSLIRALLIQVQKLKVDVALAMDGIQKMLRSQQLTFAAIGVAPSMLICFVLVKFGRGAIAGGEGAATGGKGVKASKREIRTVMRRIDRSLLLLSTPEDHHAESSVRSSDALKYPHLATGLLLLDLHRLRLFASSPSFPLVKSGSGAGTKAERRRAREEFLEDVRDLEDLGLGWESKRRIVERMWRCWGGALGLSGGY